MFKTVLKSLLFLLFGLGLLPGSLWAQGAQASGDLARTALEHFENGDYRKALPGFRELMQKNGSAPIYAYYTGRCLVEMNEELDEAIELLYKASQSDVPRDVLFYQGLAYHRFYNFREAEKYFQRFRSETGRQARKNYELDRYLAETQVAAEKTLDYNPFEVMNVTFIDLSDSLEYAQVKVRGGQLGRKPESWFGPEEDREGLSSLMFLPNEPARGDYHYFCGLDRGAREGLQIFRSRTLNGKSWGAWGAPEEVKSLNTPGDEILPYFDPINQDIYYASNGVSMGGYDLYRAHYDADRDAWSEPEQLGFPVNSVMDEYLLIPGNDLGMVLFFSNRQSTDSSIAVYRVHLVEPKKKTVPGDDLMLRQLASLGGVAGEILAEMERLQEDSPSAPEDQSEVSESAQRDSRSDYQLTLAEALHHQAKSDSLKDLAANARFAIRDSDDPNERWVWQKQIMLWEKKARDEEAMAGELYARLENRDSPVPGPAVHPPENLRLDTVIGELSVYQHVISEDASGSGPEPAQKKADQHRTNPIKVVRDPAQSPMNRFEILAASPYDENHPIPIDLALPAGVCYRIQVGAFGSEVDPGHFGGISPISGERIPERQLIKYYAGKFSRYEDASRALPRIRSLGFEDAFIVSWYKGKQLATQKAKQLE